MTRDFVIVHRTYDALQAGLLADLLQQNQIAARVIGTRDAASIGIGKSIAEVHLEVPAEQAGEATDFLEAYFAGVGAEAADDSADDDESEAEDNTDPGGTPARLSPLLAAGAMLIPFGGSHLYCRRYATAALLAAAQIIAISRLRSNNWHDVATGMVMVILLPILDAVGGQLAVRAHNRGLRASTVQQLLLGAAFIALAGGAASQLGPRIEAPAWYAR